MDCFGLLSEQHRILVQLAARLAGDSNRAKPRAQQRVAEHLRSEIAFHFYLEETHVYTVLENYDGELRAEIFSLWHDHDDIRRLLDELDSPAKCTELQETLETHFRHEEQHVFPRARRLLGIYVLQSIERNIQEELAGRRRAA